ncbi:MAG: Holliday junction resolvase RuvX [Bacillota bacterium]
MRKLALDFGDKRIGVAVSDALNITAQGKGYIKRSDLRKDLEEIKYYIDKYDVDEIIVGMPKNMDGSLGPRAKKTQEFINFLNNNLDITISIWDERLSTKEAERVLIKADVSRSNRKEVIDKMAASLILDSYLQANYKNRRNNNE